MSGIVGIINANGAPIDRPLLDRMTRFMARRGPDDRGAWADGNVGLGHTTLLTSPSQPRTREPFSLDGRVWITADARVDDRETLARRLGAQVGESLRSASGAEIILRAYSVWGEDCVHHLLGDFAFAIWDGPRRRLFCARDHFGVKPFFYAASSSCVIFSNTLNALRLHPSVSDALNELAIGDFLLFDFNQDPATTTFADIQRLPAAHRMTWSREQGLKISRYWSLPADRAIIRYAKAGDYIERLEELLRDAVGDRVRTDSVAISQSGGLDSTTLAAVACQIRTALSEPRDVRSYCLTYDKLFADDEPYYAGLTAHALGIPIKYLNGSDYLLYEHMNEPELFRPEPIHDPLLIRLRHFLAGIAGDGSRVMLFGEDPDSLLFPSTVIQMLKSMPAADVLRDVARYVVAYRRRPPLGLGILQRLNRWSGKQPGQSFYPEWLHPSFEARAKLRERWEDETSEKAARHPFRPDAYRRLTQPLWHWFLEYWDPGTTSFPIEVRFPYLDVRLVNFLLAIPTLPWCIDKELLRASMRGILPEPVRIRPKTPLRQHLHDAVVARSDTRWIDELEPTEEEASFIDRAAVPADKSWVNLRPVSLSFWFRSQRSVQFKSVQAEAV